MEKKERDRAAIFKESVDINNLTTADLVKITGKSYNTIAKYFNGNLVPDEITLVFLYSALYRAKLTIPRELSRYRSSLMSPIKRWSLDNRSGRSKPEFIGDVNDAYVYGAKRFLYKGELLNMSEIAIRSEKNLTSVSRAIKREGPELESDITSIIDSIKGRNYKNIRGRKYRYNGDLLSVEDIAEAAGKIAISVYQAIMRSNVKMNSDVTEIVNAIKSRV